ncbi:MAG: T9SS type A sorting domain-containing protein [Ignavibacteriaceae bacterium]|nr:T9SS type A sorting domain-containing protein [Ignavibacteriaceae bacterium]
MVEESSSKVVVRRGNNGSWSSFFKAGNNAVTTNNNSSGSTLYEETIITWSEGSSPNYNSKWVRRVNGSYTNAHSLSHNGKQNQVSNGTSLDNVKGTVFTIDNLPYMLSLTTTNFNQIFQDEVGINKKTDMIELSYGREGIVFKNGIEFLFNVGDIIVGDSIVKFIEQPDTVLYTSAEELNEIVKTVPFHLNQSTDFIFTDFYYVLNDSLAETVMTDSDLVNFKVELVNNQSGLVVGILDNVTYTKENLSQYAKVSYMVDCSKISPGEYYLRLVTAVEGSAEYYLGNVQNSGEELNKHNYQKISFNGLEIPMIYSLEQNYPNPFNPTTIIRYQIPQDGIVTLKVYDILGSEVATLVNEQKPAGRYEINFDASKLASGVYIYKLQSGNYISSKKMMLLK